VRSEQRDDLTGSHVQVRPTQHDPVAEPLLDPGRGQRRVATFLPVVSETHNSTAQRNGGGETSGSPSWSQPAAAPPRRTRSRRSTPDRMRPWQSPDLDDAASV